MGANPSARSFRQGYSGAGSLLEHRPTRVNQVIADMARSFVLRGLRQREVVIDSFLFRTIRPSRYFLYRAPATITRLKILASVNAGGICGQFALCPAGRLEKFPPLDLRKAATTIDRIGKGGLLYGLVPMFLLHNLEQRRTERAFQPAAHHRERSLVIVEVRHQFARKMRRGLGISFHEFFHYFEQSR